MFLRINNIFFLVLLIFLFACQNDEIRYNKLEGNVFGSTYSILYKSNKNFEFDIQNIFDEVNQSLSIYDSTSLISKINTNQTDSLDTHLIKMLNLSKEIHHQTNGYFDPTIKPLLGIYNYFYQQNLKNEIPSQQKIDSVCLSVGFDKLKIINNRVIKSNPDVQLDFNAIAVGYTVDLISDFLVKNQVENFLIDISGEIIAIGKNQNNQFWRIGVEKPNENTAYREVIGTVSSFKLAMATSGNYRKFFFDKKSNSKVVHTVNPKLCKAKASNLLSVSVIAKDCASADAYATAFMAMGKEKTLRFLEKNKEIMAFLIFQDQKNQNTLKTKMVNGFPLAPL